MSTHTDEAVVTCEVDGPVALVTMRRSRQLNSLNDQLVTELDAVLASLNTRAEVRAVVLTGEGKAFCAGADIKEFSQFTEALEFRAFIVKLQDANRAIELGPTPVIAAVNGIAFGGGLELAMACDLRVADARASFGVPEIKLGILPGAGGTQRLPRLVPAAVARQMLLTGDPIDATEAHRIGLVNEVAPEGTAVERAIALASTIATRAPLALATGKRLLDESAALSLDEGLELERDTVAGLFDTEDRTEGVAAFLEKRAPEFRGA